MMETAHIDVSLQTSVHKGPSPGIVALVTVVIFTLNVLSYIVLTGGAEYPVPSGPPETASKYFQEFSNVLRISSFLQLGAAISIGIFTATITSRLRFLGVTAASAEIALFGGVASSIFMAMSGVLTWVQSQPGISDDLSTMRSVQLASFASGGVVHMATLGLLLAGISVPSLLWRFMPRWLSWLGLVTASVAELTTLSFIFSEMFFLLPVSRGMSLLWLVGAGFKIAKTRNNIPKF
jgi:hypothetical protein